MQKPANNSATEETPLLKSFIDHQHETDPANLATAIEPRDEPVLEDDDREDDTLIDDAESGAGKDDVESDEDESSLEDNFVDDDNEIDPDSAVIEVAEPEDEDFDETDLDEDENL
jgi:hypothetical protein